MEGESGEKRGDRVMRRTIHPARVVEQPTNMPIPSLLVYLGKGLSRIPVATTGRKELVHDFCRADTNGDTTQLRERAHSLRCLTESQLRGMFDIQMLSEFDDGAVLGWRGSGW